MGDATRSQKPERREITLLLSPSLKIPQSLLQFSLPVAFTSDAYHLSITITSFTGFMSTGPIRCDTIGPRTVVSCETR